MIITWNILYCLFFFFISEDLNERQQRFLNIFYISMELGVKFGFFVEFHKTCGGGLSVWVEGPGGEEELQEGNKNHWNSISRSRGDDPTFRGEPPEKRFEIGCPQPTPTVSPPDAHEHPDRQACSNISSTCV